MVTLVIDKERFSTFFSSEKFLGFRLANLDEDGYNYVDIWTKESNLTYISTREELLNYKYQDKPLIGLFAHSHLEYFLERQDFEPTVEEMTEVAIEKLSRNPNGYYLFVEGGQIDFGHHGATPVHALTEYLEFDKAVGVGIEKTDPEETLLLVSADHSHVFTLGGYGTRGTDIFGLGERSATFVDWNILNGTDNENVHLSE